MDRSDRYKPTLIAAQNIAKLLRHVANLKFTMFNYLHEDISTDALLDIKNYYGFFSKQSHDRAWAIKIKDQYHMCRWKQYGCTHWASNTHDKFEPKSQVPRESYLTHTGSGNREVCNLVKAWKDIRRKEWKNIVLILQDWRMSVDDRWLFGKQAYIAGEPIDKYKDPNVIKDTIKKIERDVELVSFGIQTKDPASQYSNFVYVSDPNDIYKNIITIFERLITIG